MSALLPDGSAVDVTTDTTSYRPGLVALSGGGLVAICQTNDPDLSDTPAVGVRLFDADLRPAGPMFQVVAGDDGNQSPLAVTATANGGFAVLWDRTVFSGAESETTTLVQRFDASGARVGGTITLDRGEFGGPVGFTGLETGEIAVVFADFDTEATRLTVINAAGAISVDFQEFAGRTSIAGETRMSVAGEGSELIYLRNTVGDRIGTSFTRDVELIAVNAAGEVRASLQVLDNKENAGDYALARLADGRIAVAEMVANDTFEASTLVLYFADAGLTTLTGPIVSLDIQGAGHVLADLVATPDGGLVALYGEQITDPDFDTEFMAVTLNAAGVVEGEPVAVNLDPEGFQHRGDGALLPDGDVAVIFESSVDFEIHLQRLSENGDGGGGGGGGGSTDAPVIDRGTGRDDRTEGGSGDDRLGGRGGDDILKGLAGDDVLSGQGGDDTLIGGSGDDRLIGGGGRDQLVGGGGRDELLGGGGSDLLKGGGGADELHGGGGRDRLFGQGGDDFLFGEGGRDVLKGGGGDDLLDGGGGRDMLIGEAGRDVFVFGRGGLDTVVDFEIGEDRVDVSADAAGFGDLRLQDQRDGVLIRDGGAKLGFLEGVNAAELSASDFLFA